MIRTALCFRRTLVLSVLAAGAAFPQFAAAQQPRRGSLPAEVDSIAQLVLREYPNAALSLAVLRGSETIVSRGYGLANREQNTPATAQTVYRIGSVTKQFTAAAILQQVEQGKLELDTPISEYVPEYAPPGEATITLRQLLAQTSGIATYTEPPVARAFAGKQALSHADVVSALNKQSLNFAPGSRFEYSNSNYYLLGLILERATGQPYAVYLRQHLLQPAGLTSTTYCGPGATTPVQGYNAAGEELRPAPPLQMDWPYAAGALCSTVADLAAWNHALSHGRIISPALYQRMAAPATLQDDSRTAYGLGLRIDTLKGHLHVWHGGELPGYTGVLSWYPQDSLTIVILTNRGANPTVPELEGKIARRLLDIPEPETAALTHSERARYVGQYEMQTESGTVSVRILEQTGQLMIQVAGKPVLPLAYRGEDRFVLKPDPRYRFDFRVQDGHATGFTYFERDKQYQGTRKPEP